MNTNLKPPKETITVAELFGPVIQGEGSLIGMPTVFVRTGGCDFRCTWCDSMHAVDHIKHGDEWEEMEAEDVLDRIIHLSRGWPMLVSLSGGNPAQQPLGALIKAGQALEYSFALETQGTIAQDWFSSLDHLVISPKPPSSGMPFRMEKLVRCLEAAKATPQIAIKIVIFDEADYEFARELEDTFPNYAYYLQAGTEQRPPQPAPSALSTAIALDILRRDVLDRLVWLSDRVLQDHWNNVRVLPQMHALMYGDKQGV